MMIQIKYKASIHGPDKENPGETKLLFKSRIKKALIETEDIDGVFNYHGKNGKENPKRCEIAHKTLGNIVIDVPFKEMVRLRLDNRIIIKGFQYKGKK